MSALHVCPLLDVLEASPLFRGLPVPPIPRFARRRIQGMRALMEENADRNETDFWGPVSNFGIPIAAVMDTQKSPEL